MKKGVRFVFLIAISLFFLFNVMGVVSAADNSTNSANVRYDAELNWQFLISDWVPIIVDVKDISNITVPNRFSPDSQSKIEERTAILGGISDSVLSTLSKDEFQLDGKLISGRGFYGNITKEGFNKLLKDERVNKIYDNSVKGHISSGAVIKNIVVYLIPIVLFVGLIVLLIILKKKRWKTKK